MRFLRFGSVPAGRKNIRFVQGFTRFALKINGFFDPKVTQTQGRVSFSPIFWGAARSNQEGSSQEWSQEQPGAARSSQEQSGAARSSQEQAGAFLKVRNCGRQRNAVGTMFFAGEHFRAAASPPQRANPVVWIRSGVMIYIYIHTCVYVKT